MQYYSRYFTIVLYNTIFDKNFFFSPFFIQMLLRLRLNFITDKESCTRCGFLEPLLDLPTISLHLKIVTSFFGEKIRS